MEEYFDALEVPALMWLRGGAEEVEWGYLRGAMDDVRGVGGVLRMNV